jgi:hypothetical protein
MLRLALAAALLLALPSALPAAAATYESLVDRAKAGEAVGYAALRTAYAESANYQPYGGTPEAKRAMRDAFNAGDCAKVLAQAQEVLAGVFVDIEAHLLSGRCFEVGGDAPRAKLHRAIAKGLMDSIIASGDGKTTKTAFVVVAIDEEYAVLSALRWRLVSQALIDEDGHAFDRIEVRSASSSETAILFFQIDRPMKWLSRSLDR